MPDREAVAFEPQHAFQEVALAELRVGLRAR